MELVEDATIEYTTKEKMDASESDLYSETAFLAAFKASCAASISEAENSTKARFQTFLYLFLNTFRKNLGEILNASQISYGFLISKTVWSEETYFLGSSAIAATISPIFIFASIIFRISELNLAASVAMFCTVMF